MTTIVYAHPSDTSFNHYLLEKITSNLDAAARPYEVIDLYRDAFNPVLDSADLAIYGEGESSDPLVQRYASLLEKSTDLIFVFPIWWGMMPAILCGFFDKVLLKGSAWTETERGAMMPGLQVSRTLIVTTSGGPTVTSSTFISGFLTPMVLESVGITGVEWYNCEFVGNTDAAHRQAFVSNLLAHL